MQPERRRQLWLAALVVVLAAAAYRAWPRTAEGPVQSSNGRGAATTAARAAPTTAAPEVHLHALEAERPRPVSGERNLFRFRPKPPPPPPAPSPTRPSATPSPSAGPPAPPPLPPITFKFIGIVEAPEHSQKIAVLSDGRNVFHGREGDIIEGRYRVLRIGAESIELSYLDGRGRQTIRLTGG